MARAHDVEIKVMLVATAVLAVAGCSSSESSSGSTPAPVAAATTAGATTAPPTTVPPTTAPPTTVPPTTAPPPQTTTTTTTTTTTVADDPDDPFATDKALARQALLTIDDFPEGWAAVPAADDEDETDPAVQEQFDACLDSGPDSIAEQLEDREVNSPEFTAEDSSVEHEVLMADDEAMAIAAMHEVGVEGADECLTGVLQAYFDSELANNPEFAADFPPGLTIGAITVERVAVDVDPTIAVEYLVSVPLELDGDVLVTYLDVVYFRQGRALSQLQFQSVGAPFDPEGIGFLGGLVLDRLFEIGN